MKIVCLSLVLLGSILSSYAGLGNPSLSAAPAGTITYGSNAWTGVNLWTALNTNVSPAETNTMSFNNRPGFGFWLQQDLGWPQDYGSTEVVLANLMHDDSGFDTGSPLRWIFNRTNLSLEFDYGTVGNNVLQNGNFSGTFAGTFSGSVPASTVIQNSTGLATLTSTMTNVVWASDYQLALPDSELANYTMAASVQIEASSLTVAAGAVKVELSLYYTNASQTTWTPVTFAFPSVQLPVTNTIPAAYTAASGTINTVIVPQFKFTVGAGSHPYIRLFGRVNGTVGAGSVKLVNYSISGLKSD